MEVHISQALRSSIGGPGGSGVDRILEQGARLQKIVDSQSDPFDKVSWCR